MRLSHAALRRIDDFRVEVTNPHTPITLFANDQVEIEAAAVDQVLDLARLAQTIEDRVWCSLVLPHPVRLLSDRFALSRIVLTPDFHKGAKIPIGTVAETHGFVIPQAVGNDVGCGMRLLATDIAWAELTPILERLAAPLRYVFFQGGRDIPMSPTQREALLRDGLWGLHETSKGMNAGVWQYYVRSEEELNHAHSQGVFPATGVFAFDDYIRSSGKVDGRDSQIGSVGGGNHFVELQAVLKTSTLAYDWGLKLGTVTIMVHSGSVGLGHLVGGHFVDEAKKIFPKELKKPSFYVLPTIGKHKKLGLQYLDAMHNAANFALGNRLMLGLMAVRVLSEVLGRRIKTRLVYDAPHNLIWPQKDDTYLHRKGACPAGPPNNYFPSGHPVIIPGSMGAESYVLVSAANVEALHSACHGAGRAMSRGAARHADDVKPLHIVTPVDPDAPEIRGRSDVLTEYRRRMKEEAPDAYKPITPIIDTVEAAAIARQVATLQPLLTIKG